MKYLFLFAVKDIENLINELSQKHNMPMRVGFSAQRGYHIQMTKTSVKAIKGRQFHISHLPKEFLNPSQCKNTISFTTEPIVQLDAQSQGVIREITLMTNIVIQELICTLRTNIGSLYKFSEATTSLDLLLSFADVSSMPNFVRPRFGSMMLVKGSRHPILDKMDLPGKDKKISQISQILSHSMLSNMLNKKKLSTKKVTGTTLNRP